MAAGRRHDTGQVIGCIDFRYLTDAVTRDEALGLLTKRATGKAERIAQLEANGNSIEIKPETLEQYQFGPYGIS